MEQRSQQSTFVVAPNIIFSLIKAQAGSLSKAVLECIMNSIDAGATDIYIDFDDKNIKIKDNGKGFQSLDEIKQCFNVFGFDHSDQERTYGQFGIGRAQMWNFCSTVWRTNTFSMDVDIKNKGLDYEIKDNLSSESGLVIDGFFYETQSATDLNYFQVELTSLAKYAQANVYLNNKLINKNPLNTKWPHETDEAWIELKEHGELTIYNLGVKVKSFPCSFLGCGGTVITKPNVRLSLNMARNDIIVSDCPVWKKLNKDLQKLSNNIVGKQTASKALSYDKIKNIINQMVNGDYEVNYKSFYETKMIPNIQNRKLSLSDMLDKMKNHKFSIGEKGDIVLEKAHISETVFVFNEIIYDLFGSDNVNDILEKLFLISKNAAFHVYIYEKDTYSRNYMHPDQVRSDYSSFYNIIPSKEYDDFEKTLLDSISACIGYLIVAFSYVTDEKLRRREIKIGTSDTAEAWTDGDTYIVLNKDLIKKARDGFGGISKIAHIIAHEYVHNTNNSGSHTHDIDFYNLYHDITIHDNFQLFVKAINTSFIKKCFKKGIKLNVKALKTFDDINDEIVAYDE